MLVHEAPWDVAPVLSLSLISSHSLPQTCFRNRHCLCPHTCTHTQIALLFCLCNFAFPAPLPGINNPINTHCLKLSSKLLLPGAEGTRHLLSLSPTPCHHNAGITHCNYQLMSFFLIRRQALSGLKLYLHLFYPQHILGPDT